MITTSNLPDCAEALIIFKDGYEIETTAIMHKPGEWLLADEIENINEVKMIYITAWYTLEGDLLKMQ